MCPINPINNRNPVRSHSSTWQYICAHVHAYIRADKHTDASVDFLKFLLRIRRSRVQILAPSSNTYSNRIFCLLFFVIGSWVRTGRLGFDFLQGHEFFHHHTHPCFKTRLLSYPIGARGRVKWPKVEADTSILKYLECLCTSSVHIMTWHLGTIPWFRVR